MGVFDEKGLRVIAMKKITLPILLFVGFAASTFAEPTTVDVRLKGDDREKQFEPSEMKVGGVTPGYTALKPDPFVYSTDATEQKRIRGFEGRPFVVAGVNCDKPLRHVASITGV